jgi:hypothetical protein
MAGGMTHGTRKHAAPLALPLGRDGVHDVGDHEADKGLEGHGAQCEQAGLPDHHPERVAAEQEGEVAEADEPRHALVQHREPDRITRGIGDQHDHQGDHRQGHQEGDGRLAL